LFFSVRFPVIISSLSKNVVLAGARDHKKKQEHTMQILTVPSAKTCATRTHNAEIVLLQSRINSRASPARIYDHRDRERLQINFKLGSPLITTKIQNWETLTTTRPKSTRGISEKLNYISPAGRFQECPHCRQRRSNAPFRSHAAILPSCSIGTLEWPQAPVSVKVEATELR